MMAIQIIEKGVWPRKPDPKKVRCQRCLTKFSYEFEDIEAACSDGSVRVACPLCGERVHGT